MPHIGDLQYVMKKVLCGEAPAEALLQWNGQVPEFIDATWPRMCRRHRYGELVHMMMQCDFLNGYMFILF